MPSPRDRKLAGAIKLLQWVNNDIEGAPQCSLNTDGAMTLVEKMMANQGWGEDRTPAKTQKGMHTVKGDGYACRKNRSTPQKI
jgi:hypothetical protein